MSWLWQRCHRQCCRAGGAVVGVVAGRVSAVAADRGCGGGLGWADRTGTSCRLWCGRAGCRGAGVWLGAEERLGAGRGCQVTSFRHSANHLPRISAKWRDLARGDAGSGRVSGGLGGGLAGGLPRRPPATENSGSWRLLLGRTSSGGTSRLASSRRRTRRTRASASSRTCPGPRAEPR